MFWKHFFFQIYDQEHNILANKEFNIELLRLDMLKPSVSDYV